MTAGSLALSSLGIGLILLGPLSGCCLGITGQSSEVPDSGIDGGPRDGGNAVDGGERGCLVDGGSVHAGAWLSTEYGSCAICDPSLNPDDWTVQAAGASCRGFGIAYPGSADHTIPFAGICESDVAPPFTSCNCAFPGSKCFADVEIACCGGVCKGGVCTVTENLGWLTVCGTNQGVPDSCSAGPCCPDAGFKNILDGGWCCGLVDGGLPTCLGAGEVCIADANCCADLRCKGPDGGYGTCL